MKKLNLILRLASLTLAISLPGMALGQASAPASLTAASCAGQSFLSWSASAGAASYDVQRATASGGPYTLLANVGSGTLTYADTAVTNGGEYYYVVAAVSNGVAGANSPEAAAIPLAGGDYTIANRVSGLALDSAGSVADQQNYTGVNQLWQLVPFGHFYEIINAGNNLALSGPTASAQLTLSSFTENLDQLWLLEVTNSPNGPYYVIYNVNTSQVMDDFNSSLTNGATIGQWDYDGGQNQNWTLTQILPPQIQSPAVASVSQFSEATVSALVNPNTLPTTVIIQFGTNTAYGQAVTNTFAATNSYQSVSDNFDYPIIDVTTLHALITASNAAGTVTSGDITGGSALFVETYGSDYNGEDARFLNPTTGSAVWLDNDDDGWLDLALSGQTTLNTCLGYLDWNPGTNPPTSYPNYAWVNQYLPGGNRGGLAVGDFDNDNRPDLFVATAPGGQILNGFSGNYPICAYNGGAVSGIMYGTDYKDTRAVGGNAYNLTNTSFSENMMVQDATLAVGDFDRNGWQNVLLSGDFFRTNSGLGIGPDLTLLLQNNLAGGRNLTNTIGEKVQSTNTAMLLFNSSLPILDTGYGWSSGETVFAAGDFDNDGFPDVFAFDFFIDSTHTPYFGFFHNDGNGNFTPTSRYQVYPGTSGEQASLIATASCVLADLNGDGHLDMVLGYQYTGPAYLWGTQTNSIWLNDGHGNLTNSNIVLPQLNLANFAVGDIFNHGRNDILMVGTVGLSTTIQTIVLRNDGNGVFTPIVLGNFGSIGETGHGLALADYDNDGRLDFAMTGDTQPLGVNESANFIPGTYIFRNLMNIPSNAPPAAPPNLSTTVGNGTVTFHWSNATDDITPANLLTYNLRVGTNSLGTQTVSPLANVTTGWRKIAAPGNCGHTTNILYRFPPGTYYWSVQAVDGGFKGGAWAPEQTFTITNAEPVTLALNQPPAPNSYLDEQYQGAPAEFLYLLTLVNISSNVLNVTSNTLNLSWPARFNGWTVEQTTNLANPVWVTNTTPVGTLDDEWSLLVTNNAGPIYFRLVK